MDEAAGSVVRQYLACRRGDIGGVLCGLAAGSWFWGRRSTRAGNPLRVYAGLELGIAVTALLYFVVMKGYHVVYPEVYQSVHSGAWLLLIKFLLALVLIFPPAFCMGGTIPVVGQHAIRNPSPVRIDLGLALWSQHAGRDPWRVAGRVFHAALVRIQGDLFHRHRDHRDGRGSGVSGFTIVFGIARRWRPAGEDERIRAAGRIRRTHEVWTGTGSR